MEAWTTTAPLLGVAGLVVAFIIYVRLKAGDAGSSEMVEISDDIHEGAMAFLKREYSILLLFVAVVFVALWLGVGARTAVAFLAGAGSSILAGFSGMKAATRANVRTAQAANRSGQGPALSMAFAGGAVMGLAVASLGLLGISLLAQLFGVWEDASNAAVINGFAMGASSIALFARVGGGIFTKAADVGADLVGKVEQNIPEDDPRNPAVIADNVGDNVGDVAGMGADIFESYVGSVIATIAIAATGTVATLGTLAPGLAADQARLAAMAFPLTVIMVGLVASLAGVLAVRLLQNTDPGAALRYATFVSAALMVAGAWWIGRPAGAWYHERVLGGPFRRPGGWRRHRSDHRVLYRRPQPVARDGRGQQERGSRHQHHRTAWRWGFESSVAGPVILFIALAGGVALPTTCVAFTASASRRWACSPRWA